MKVCRTCRTPKPLDAFRKAKNGALGVAAHCKECVKAVTPEQVRAREAEAGVIDKPCGGCGEVKEIEAFGIAHGKRRSRCNPCLAGDALLRRRAAPEKAKEIWQRSARKNRNMRLAAGRTHYAENRAYYASKNAQWARDNAAANRARRARYRARKLGAPGSHTREEWKELRDRYGRCLRCGATGVHLEPDHVVPLSKGGSDSIENLQPLCRSCNSSKGDKVADYREDRDGPGDNLSSEAPAAS
ncbi:HNH endonuclease signature motif containing protein [Streptomyces sp. NPDC005395]|uniref:HNH endonuclease n=1 Tax=Streptomyces sp. NPDC005395 TaxID=3157042 RepID=UPI0033A05BF2